MMLWRNRKYGTGRQLCVRSKYPRKRVVLRKRIEKFILSLAAISLVYLSFTETEELQEGSQDSTRLQRKPILFENITLNKPAAQTLKGLSIVAACRNSHEDLRHTLPTWVRVKQVSEVVVIDWGSKPPLRFLIEELNKMDSAPPVYVLEVRNETIWEPARAFNLGFRVAHASHILRIDCDVRVNNEFVLHHSLPSSAFYNGGGHLERSEIDEHLNSILLIERKQLIGLGGYDERLQNCSCEHQDLLLRLQRTKIKRMNLNYNMLRYVHETNSAQKGLTSSERAEQEVFSEVHQLLTENLTSWTYKSAIRNFSFKQEMLSTLQNSSGKSRHENVQYRAIHAAFKVPSFLKAVPANDRIKQEHSAVNDLLQEMCTLPRELAEVLPLQVKIRLFGMLRTSLGQFKRFCKKKAVLIHCTHDIVARMGVLISGLAFARHTGRTPLIIWEKEKSLMNSSFHTMFQERDGVLVVDELLKPISESLKDWGERGIAFHDLTGAKQKSNTIRNDPSLHLYIKSETRISSNVVRYTGDHAFQEEFGELVYQPEIHDMLRKLVDQGLERALGIHVSTSVLSDGSSSEWKGFVDVLNTQYVKMRQRYGTVFVLADVDVSTRDLLRRELPDIALTSLPTYSSRPSTEAATQDLLRILAFSRTAVFVSNTKDAFSSLVSSLRGDDNVL